MPRPPTSPVASPVSALAVLSAVSALLGAPLARAATSAVAPAGGGLPALSVRIDLAGGVVSAGDLRVPIALAADRRPGEGAVVTEAIVVGDGRSVVHVRIPAKDDDGLAWEALLVASASQPLFAGLTGFTEGDPGERTGKQVRIVPAGATADRRFVLVGDIREDLRICGQDATLLDPQALYPAALELRPATVQRLDDAQRAAAQPIVAQDHGPTLDPALARLLVARGSSAPGSRGAELTDGDPSTAWHEARPGAGQGEFVVMAAPRDVPITRMQLVAAPAPKPPATALEPAIASPRTFYLVTGSESFAITLPGDASLKPGEAYEIAFPKPLQTSCLALVLGDAYGRNQPHPEVTVAELVAYSELDTPRAASGAADGAPPATLDDVAKALGGPRGVVAAQVLERAGAPALAAVTRVYGSLGPAGRALAIDVASAHDRCEESAPLLARGLCESSGEAPRKAHEKLERCRGAAAVLSDRLRQDPASRACVAPTLVALAGEAALEPIADAIAATPVSDASTRAVLRGAFAEALGSGAPAPLASHLASLLGDESRSAQARLELLRAAGPRVVQVQAESERVLSAALPATAAMRERYLALGPLGELARHGDESAATRLSELVARDPAWPVRARAAEVSAGVASAVMKAALLAAVRDPEPRVREAALASLATGPSPDALAAAEANLADDRWSFVKVQAIALMARAGASADVDHALGQALQDASARVRGGAVIALGQRRAASLAKDVRARLDDASEDTDVRAAAARVLGAFCDASAADRLTELAGLLATVGKSDDDQQVGLAALEGLAAMHPADLASRLAPLRAKTSPPSVHNAADRALQAHGVCPVTPVTTRATDTP